MIYTSAILHNFCTVHARDVIDMSVQSDGWQEFLKDGKQHLCPTCRRSGRVVCLHQNAFRNGVAQTAAARSAPSAVRDALRHSLWEAVKAGVPHGTPLEEEDVQAADAEGAQIVRTVMEARAAAGRGDQRYAACVP